MHQRHTGYKIDQTKVPRIYAV